MVVAIRCAGFPSETIQGGLRLPRIQNGSLDFCSSEVDSPEQPTHTETRMGMIT